MLVTWIFHRRQSVKIVLDVLLLVDLVQGLDDLHELTSANGDPQLHALLGGLDDDVCKLAILVRMLARDLLRDG